MWFSDSFPSDCFGKGQVMKENNIFLLENILMVEVHGAEMIFILFLSFPSLLTGKHSE